MPVKSLYRDKLEDDELDLSLMQLEEVPVQQLVIYQDFYKFTTVTNFFN